MTNTLFSFEKPSDNVVEIGNIQDIYGKNKQYKIVQGLDFEKALIINDNWGRFTWNIFEKIRHAGYSNSEIYNMLSQINAEDLHWDWGGKSMVLNGSQYEWFYFHINGRPHGACVFHHPEKSELNTDDIFYVEYIAVAPWNRTHDFNKAELKGVGTILLKCALKYSLSHLNLGHGFSLHSLPQASGFYKNKGMIAIPNKEKDGLDYYELPRAIAEKWMEV